MPVSDRNYKGARFFKCDLQTQTPAHQECWEGEYFSPDKEGAIKFIESCYSVGLEVIGITDHNFRSKQFIPHLQQAARELGQDHEYEIVIFPGFEVQARVGRGLHVIALFEPGANLDEIDHVLTQCGVPPNRFEDGKPARSSKGLKEIINIVQNPVARGQGPKGIVFCPHSQSDAGIFDTDRISEWLQLDEYKNSELLALEVPKPPSDMSEGWQSLLLQTPSCMPEWRRARPIACIMSSDCKALAHEDNITNRLGRRYTWIKMGEPSIEALRQAFLDPDSRIRLQERNPDDSYNYPIVKKVSVKNVTFLEDVNLSFSKNLNAIIGGRGSGKSTILEYVRILMQQVRDIDRVALDSMHRAGSTIEDASSLIIEIEREGRTWSFTYARDGEAPVQIDGSEVGDLPSFFPIQVYSQRELAEIAEKPREQLKIIERAALDTLAELRDDAAKLYNTIKQCTDEVRGLSEVPNALKEMRAKQKAHALIVERLKPLVGIASELAKHRSLEQELRHIDEMLMGDMVTLETFAKQYERISEEHAHQASTAEAPIQGYRSRLREAYRENARRLRSIAEEFKKASVQYYGARVYTDWKVERERVEREYEAKQVEQGAGKEGVSEADFLQSKEAFDALEKRILDNERRLSRRDALRKKRREALSELKQVWDRQYEVRKQACREIEQSIPSVGPYSTKLVKLFVTKHGDRQHFVDMMRSLLSDGRRVSEEDWDELLERLYDTAMQEGVYPTEKFIEWVSALEEGEVPVGYPWELQDKRTAAFRMWCTEESLWSSAVQRINDRIEMTLYRQDGTEVGNVFGGALSVGQKSTAMLAILLGTSEDPILIDQPEDDLDNEFIYRELVPLLRALKERRQIIVATHNANIPVNADAENIIAFETVRGRGRVKVVRGGHDDLGKAIGSLDRRAVQYAVSEIMEGSEDAFRKRFEKYGF